MTTSQPTLPHMPGERLHRFHGGLRLRHNKKVSCQDAVIRPPLPDQLLVPTLQHWGEAAEPVVAQGEFVLKGQLIASIEGKPGANIHAPTSGEILSLETGDISHPSGLPGPCIMIRPDGRDEWIDLSPVIDWPQADPQMLRRKIREAGVVGLGGAVFPTGIKLDAGTDAGIHTLILNGAECEPYISSDEMLMREQPRRVVRGAGVLLKALGASKAIIAIEDQMGAIRKSLNQAARELGQGQVEVILIPKIYPEGGERQLIQVLTGAEVPAGGYPHDLGLVCLNVGTAVAANEAIFKGKPLLERYVTVTGNGVEQPRNFNALIGTPVSHLVDAAGGYRNSAARLVIGGPMMGYALPNDQSPVVKATNCLLVLSEEDIAPPQPEMPCIRCGECARVCPAQLLPQELHFYTRTGQWDETRDLGLSACIECGCCDFVCPSHIPLAEWFRYGKSELRHLDREKTFSELSRQRHEARDERQARAKAEKTERLARRKQKLKSEQDRKKQIAAAIKRVADKDAQ